MTTLALSSFDTLQYVKHLKAADVPEKQAEAQAEALSIALNATLADHAAQLATKGDLAAVHKELGARIDLTLKEIAIARRDTIIWLGGMLFVGFGTVIGLMLR